MGLSIEREKVIKELESLRDICNAKYNMAMGKGKVAWAGYANTADDAITLLKEQDDKIRQLRLALQIMNGNGIRVDTKGR